MARPTDRLSRRQERKLLSAGRRVFAEQFPNPDRIGCPSTDVLRAMASRWPTADGRLYPVEHLAMCSPCFRQYGSYRRQVQFVKGARFALIAATAVLVLGALLWLSLGRRKPEIARQLSPPQFQLVTLDLRPLSLPRGESNPEAHRPTLTLPRGRLRITFQLPVGSEEGQYEVRLLAGDGHPALVLRGQARILDYVTTLRTEADLRELNPGRYALRIGRSDRSWQAYSIALE